MLELISEHTCFGGVQRFYSHRSSEIGLPMRFTVFLPAQARTGKVPALFYLAGLICTEETFCWRGSAIESVKVDGDANDSFFAGEIQFQMIGVAPSLRRH